MPDETYPIRGNLIGVAADGVTPLGNGGDGIQLGGSAAVGGFEPGAANTIAYNGGDGVSLRLERDVWTFLTGQTETAYLRGNVIHSNAGLGIDVGSDGVNAPLPGTDRGLNFYPNYPVLTRVFSGNGTTTVEGTVSAINLPLQGWRFDNVMDFYASPTADPSGYGEGLMYLGSHSVFTYDTASFSVTLPVEVPAGHVITATNSRWNMISEFSAVLVVQPDADGDGVLDAVEDAGPNGGDANNDGAPDRLQNEIASLPNAVDGQYVVLEVQPGGTLRDVRAWDKPSSDDGPPGVVFPARVLYIPRGKRLGHAPTTGGTNARHCLQLWIHPGSDVRPLVPVCTMDSAVPRSFRIGRSSTLRTSRLGRSWGPP